MLRRLIFPILLGLSGLILLCSLGIWQIGRMYEKRAQLDEMTAGITTPAVAVPATYDPETDRFRPVTVAGDFTGERLYVISGKPDVGAGVRVISVLQTDTGRRLLIDRGFLLDQDKQRVLTQQRVELIGNMMWPRDANEYTPPPDAKTGLWFARDAEKMAALLNTEPLMIVARTDTGDGIEPVPVNTASIPNDHWGYAITWFSLAFVWALMTGALIWRITTRKD
jgi:surfeit locus 1 family protein